MAKRGKKLAVDQNRAPDLLRWDKEGNLPPPPPPAEAPPQEEPQHADQPFCAAAVMMHGPPPMRQSGYRPSAACPTVLEGRQLREAPQQDEVPQFPMQGYHESANLWNLDIPSRALKPGPMASFLRRVPSMESPNNPSYAESRIEPVLDVRDLRREAALENVAAHQRYLEKLQFGMNTLRSWSNSIHDQIMGEAQQVHLQWMRVVQKFQRQSVPNAWGQGWPSASNPPPPRPAQAPVQSSSLPIKAPPAPRGPSQQAPSSNMSSAPRNAPFPDQMGADPWARAKQNQQ